MKQEHTSYRTDALCRLFGKSCQAYYERSQYVAVKAVGDEVILQPVGEARKYFPRMGARKLMVYLKASFEAVGINIGRDALIGLLYRNFMPVRRVRNKRTTTYSNHRMHKYPNLITDFTPIQPNQLWVSDITCVEAGSSGMAYLSLITDVCSHRVVGWNLARNLRAEGTLAALKMALRSLKDRQTCLVHHSDRGSQYCCREYVELLAKHKVRISMTENGDPRENAIAERINGILKTEWLYDYKPDSWKSMVAYTGRVIDLYNSHRPHQSIGYMVPEVILQTGMRTERKWKNYYHVSI
jgi:transposase InsO family protein